MCSLERTVALLPAWCSFVCPSVCPFVSLLSPEVPNGYTTKCSKLYWSNPPFLFFLTFGHSGAQDYLAPLGLKGLRKVCSGWGANVWRDAIPSGWCSNEKRTVWKLAVRSWYNKVTTRCGPESNVRARLTEFGQICRCRSVDNSIH